MIQRKKGLTLIELLAVIAIIAILFVLLIPQINSAINKAREAGVMTDFRDFETNIRSYLMSNDGTYEGLGDFNKNVLKTTSKSVGVSVSPYGKNYVSRVFGHDFFMVTDLNVSLYVYEQDGEVKVFTTGLSSDRNASPVKTYGDYEYRVLHDKEIAIVGFKNNNVGSLDIPEKIEEKPVTMVLDSAFENKGITALDLPESVFYLGPRAFMQNQIASFEPSENLTKIGFYALGNNALTTLNINKNIDTVGYGAFQNNDLKTVNITASKLKELTVGVFRVNEIDTLTITSPLEVIEERAFHDNSITHVNIPSTVRLMQTRVFDDNPLGTYKFLGNTPQMEGDPFPSGAVQQ